MATELSLPLAQAVEASRCRNGTLRNDTVNELEYIGLFTEHLTKAEYLEILSPECQFQSLTPLQIEQIASKDVRNKLGVACEWIHACKLLESAADYAIMFDRRALFVQQFKSLLTEDNHGFVTDTLRNAQVWTKERHFTLSANYSSFEEWLALCTKSLITTQVYAFLHGRVDEIQRLTSIMIPEIEAAIYLLQNRVRTSIHRVQRVINITVKPLEDEPTIVIEPPPAYRPRTPKAEVKTPVETSNPTEICTISTIFSPIKTIHPTSQIRKRLSFYAPDVHAIRQALKARVVDIDKETDLEKDVNENKGVGHHRRGSIRKIGLRLRQKLKAVLHHEIKV